MGLSATPLHMSALDLNFSVCGCKGVAASLIKVLKAKIRVNIPVKYSSNSQQLALRERGPHQVALGLLQVRG